MDSSPLRFLQFELSGKAFALPIAQVREIFPMAELTRPPQMPLLIEGFLNLGGIATPVLRLDRILNFEGHHPDVNSHLIWLREDHKPVILAVDRVLAVFHIPSESLLPLADRQTFNQCVVGLIRLKETTVHVLSVEQLLLQQERKTLEEFSLLEQKRLFNTGRETA